MRAALVALALALTAVAQAQTPALVIRPDQVGIGERVVIEITLANDSDEGVDLPEPTPDGKELEIRVGWGSRSFLFRHLRDGVRSLHELKPHEKLQGTVEIPAVRAGDMLVEAKIGAVSCRKTVKVLPGPRGEDRVGVRLETSKGPIGLRFFPEAAPNTVLHFVELAGKGFYNGLVFHRVIPGFMMQGGDPKGTGLGGPGYTLPSEFSRDPRYVHRAGRLAMARTKDPESAGSQFYICFADAPSLNGAYTVFGEVSEGMETVKAVEKVGSKSGEPSEQVTIEKAALVLYKDDAGK